MAPRHQKSSVSRYRYRGLLLFILLALAGYSILWQAVAYRIKSDTVQALDQLGQKDLFITYGRIGVSGFPYRLVLSLNDIEVRSESGNLWAKSAGVSLTSHLWTPSQWLLSTRPATVFLPFVDRDAFQIPYLEASWRRLGATGSRVVVDLKQGTGLAGGNDRLILGLLIPGSMEKKTPDTLLEDTLAAITVRYTRPAIDNGSDTSISATARLTGPLLTDFSLGSLAYWRDQGGLLDVRSFSWSDKVGAVKGSASLTLDQQAEILGTVTLQPSGSGAFPFFFSEFIPSSFKRPSPSSFAGRENANTEIALSFQQGFYSVNGQRRGSLKSFSDFLNADKP